MDLVTLLSGDAHSVLVTPALVVGCFLLYRLDKRLTKLETIIEIFVGEKVNDLVDRTTKRA